MEPPSSPPSASTNPDNALAWYKLQYEQLEAELSEFRESSKELEQELEKDIELAEKRERALQERAENLSYEVEEWKCKYKESKAEASTAQNALEKEITTLREANRTLQLRIRDIEVANDDFERQARNTTSSLEDLESKYNVAIERAVLMEEEIKIGEQEREQLRIDAQRLKEELSDLKIDAELLQNKIKRYESRHLSSISTDISIIGSPTFDKNTDHSPVSTASSPLITTPPGSGSPSTHEDSNLAIPPSPPMSDASISASLTKHLHQGLAKTVGSTQTPTRGLQRKSRLPSTDFSTPKPKPRPSLPSLTRQPSARLSGAGRTPGPRTSSGMQHSAATPRMPTSNSLSHIRLLTAKMQRLEARVQSVRSKLPAPSNTPPRASPGGFYHHSNITSSVTVRPRKHTTGSTTPSILSDGEITPKSVNLPPMPKMLGSSASKHLPRPSLTGVTKISFAASSSRRESDVHVSRPSSRASIARPSSRTDMAPPPRPGSRTSFSGIKTPVGRPHSSMSGSMHGYSGSISSRHEFDDIDEDEIRTPSRQGVYNRYDMESGIPTPSGLPIASHRRQSVGRRVSSSIGFRDRLNDLDETY